MLLKSIAATMLATVMGTGLVSGANADPNLFEGVSTATPKAGAAFYITSARGRPVMTLTDQARISGSIPTQFGKVTPLIHLGDITAPLRLVESTTATKQSGVILGNQINCGGETCWEVNFATNGVNPDYGLILLERDVPLNAGQILHGCFSDPDVAFVSGNRPAWVKLNSGAADVMPRIVLRPISGTSDQYQLRAVSVQKNAVGRHEFRQEIMLNGGTTNTFDDETLKKTDFTCTWRITTQDDIDLYNGTPQETGIAQESLDELRAYYKDAIPFKLFASNGKFCTKYKQFNSNAGQCPTCTVTMTDGATAGHPAGSLLVTANNNWSGVVTPSAGGQSALANGSGSWSSKISGPYSGLDFNLKFEHLNSVMTMHMKSKLGTVVGEFRCAD
ncbi:MAG: hypothetical protein ACPGGK_17220 [Pikeienuella sp.]